MNLADIEQLKADIISIYTSTEEFSKDGRFLIDEIIQRIDYLALRNAQLQKIVPDESMDMTTKWENFDIDIETKQKIAELLKHKAQINVELVALQDKKAKLKREAEDLRLEIEKLWEK